MAQITPGHNFFTGEAVQPADFHEFVDDGFLVNVRYEDCLAAGKPIFRTTPSVPATGDVRVGSDGRLEFYFGGAWITQEADAVAITLTNGSGSDLEKGSVVVAKHTTMNEFTVTTVNRPTDVIGVLIQDISNGASGQVCIRGRCQAFVLGNAGGSPAGTPLKGPDPTAAPVFTRDYISFWTVQTAGIPLMSDTFATLLEDIVLVNDSRLSWVRLGK